MNIQPAELDKYRQLGDLAFSLAHVYVSALLLAHCAATGDASDLLALRQFVGERVLAPVVTNAKEGVYERGAESLEGLVYDGYSEENMHEPEQM